MENPTNNPATSEVSGLDLAEAFFDAFGRPMIETRFPEIKSRIAAGLVGMGSECLGFDDTFSRDHDWGPGFCLWLGAADYERWGKNLQRGYDGLPERHNDVRRCTSLWGQGRVGVRETGGFYRSLIGLSDAPKRSMEWLVVPEYNFASCTSGKVFYDPMGSFSSIREKIKAYYPEDVRLKKIAARCMSAAQSGQYNYRRCLMRSDAYGANCALIRFCEDVLALIFLFNRRFMPYYKWHVKAASNLPVLGTKIVSNVKTLCQSIDPDENSRMIDSICVEIAGELRRQGMSRIAGNALLDHGPEIHSQIQDPELKMLDVWYGGG